MIRPKNKFTLWWKRVWWDSDPRLLYRRFKAWQGVATDEKGREIARQGTVHAGKDGYLVSKRLPLKLPYPPHLR